MIFIVAGIWVLFCFFAGWMGSHRKAGFFWNMFIAVALSGAAALSLAFFGMPGFIFPALLALPVLQIIFLAITEPKIKE